jgi:DNA polymerase-1
MKKLMVIDTQNLIFRAYYGFSRYAYLSHNGKPTFMAYGMAMAMNRLIRDYQPDYVIMAREGGGKTARHVAFPTYKSGRKETPDDFKSQIDDVEAMLTAYGIMSIKVPQVEADDIIGTLATRFASDDLNVYIVSGDKDFMQMINKNTHIIRHANDGYEIVGAEGVKAKFGCSPDKVVECMAIIGDAADAIPGVKGIGEKGAAGLIELFGTLEGVYENLGSIKPKMAEKLEKSKDMAFLSRELVTITKDIPFELNLEDCAVSEDIFSRPEVISFYESMGFKSLLPNVKEDNKLADEFALSFEGL